MNEEFEELNKEIESLPPGQIPDQLKISSIDTNEDTFIEIGCYRETHRLDRVLKTYQKALTLAEKDGQSNIFRRSLASLHDHKGCLTACWNHVPPDSVRNYVKRAWGDEAEYWVIHTLAHDHSQFWEDC